MRSSTFTTTVNPLQTLTLIRKGSPRHSPLPGDSCGEYFDTFEDAVKKCKTVMNDCDLLIEYTTQGHSHRKFYEVGKIDRNLPTCPYNSYMPAVVIWCKNKALGC